MSTTKRLRTMALLVALVAGSGLTACATTRPSQELMDARRAYNNVATGQAATLVPAQVLSAKEALQQAEEAHNEDPGSLKERSLAYVAHRHAQLAATYANVASAQHERKTAQNEFLQTQEMMRKMAQSQLRRTRGELEVTEAQLERVRGELEQKGSTLDARTQQLRAQEKELEAHMAELQSEREARKQAEEAAAAAIASLERVAQVKQEARGTVITLSGAVLFQTSQSGLLPIAEQRLDMVAKALEGQEENATIVVEGHTDSRGSEQLNMRLSQERAEAVRNYLIAKGANPDRIRAVGKGENFPIAPNATPEGRANNRRVEIVIQPPPSGQNRPQTGQPQ